MMKAYVNHSGVRQSEMCEQLKGGHNIVANDPPQSFGSPKPPTQGMRTIVDNRPTGALPIRDVSMTGRPFETIHVLKKL
jgi:hypothetical protein